MSNTKSIRDKAISDWIDEDACCQGQVDIKRLINKICDRYDEKLKIPEGIIECAKDFIESIDQREEKLEAEDYDASFEIECNQRDNASFMADWILKEQTIKRNNNV